MIYPGVPPYLALPGVAKNARYSMNQGSVPATETVAEKPTLRNGLSFLSNASVGSTKKSNDA